MRRINKMMKTRGRFWLLPPLLLCAAGAIYAADNDFRTEAELAIGSDQNPQFTGGSASSETVVSVSLDLKWLSRTPRTELEFVYTPSIFGYPDNDLLGTSDSHLLRGTLRHRISEAASFQFSFDGSSSEEQGRLGETLDVASTLLPRTRILRGAVNLEWAQGTGSGNEWRYGVRAQSERYDDDLTAAALDTDRFWGHLAWTHPVSQRARVGVRFGHETASFPSGTDADIDAVVVTYLYRLGKRTSTILDAGLSRVDQANSSHQDPTVRVSLSRSLSDRSGLELSLEQSSTGGYGLPSASRDLGLELRWRRAGKKVDGDIRFGWWDRTLLESGGPGFEGTRSLVSNESLRWKIGRRWMVGVYHEYRKQDPVGGGSALIVADDQAGGVLFRVASRPL